jgi:acyl-coenzyme A synthetase/AMP-(fatty) acid ligase
VKSYSHNVYAIFSQIVERYSDRPALVWPQGEIVTFAKLADLSDKAALCLCRHGVQKGDRVCLRLEKCTLAYALIIGCLKIGAPYFFVDPNNPEARTAHMLDKCKPGLIFSAREIPLELSGYRIVTVDQSNQFAALETGETGNVEEQADIIGTDAAYIMFTSGSTGFPKGAVMSHANLLNFIQWARYEFSITPDDIFSGVNPLFFDNSVFDFYAGIMN